MIIEVTSKEHIEAHERAVVCFTNPLTCWPCKQFAPHYANAADALKDEVPFLEVDTTQHMDLAQEYGVMGTPTVLYILNGKAVNIASRTTMPLINEVKGLLDA